MQVLSLPIKLPFPCLSRWLYSVLESCGKIIDGCFWPTSNKLLSLLKLNALYGFESAVLFHYNVVITRKLFKIETVTLFLVYVILRIGISKVEILLKD